MAEDIIDILVTNYNDNVTLELDPAVTVVNISNLSGLTGIIIPSGTIGRLPYYDTTSTFADSNIYTTGTIVGINNDTPTLYSTNKGMVVRNPAGNVELLLQHDGNTANSIQGLSISTVKTDAAYIFQRENLPLKLGTNDTARATIAANGNFGIGTTAPTQKQHIYNEGASLYTRYQRAVDQDFYIGIDSSGFALSGFGNLAMYFSTNSLERIRITESGNFYIGKTSGVSKFGISGLPTSASGLSTGDIWSDSGTLKIV